MRAERSPPKSLPCDVGRLERADLGVVEALARLQLVARRRGRRVELLHASEELRALIEFLGLADVLPLRVEPGRQAEQREQPLGVEEEGDPGEPVA